VTFYFLVLEDEIMYAIPFYRNYDLPHNFVISYFNLGNKLNFLSKVLATTIIAQGETFTTDAQFGPEFPAHSTISIPLCIEWNAPIDIPSLKIYVFSCVSSN
jgi:hypothetical protein